MDKGAFGRKDRLIKERRHDVYKERSKLPDPTRCSNCGAVFTGGRWTWTELPTAANDGLCPACRRIVERVPAGVIHIRGAFPVAHRDDVRNLIANIEKQEKGQHPLERIMNVEEDGELTTVTTTGVHVARRIGEALARAFKGELTLQYAEAEKSIRVEWQRDA